MVFEGYATPLYIVPQEITQIQTHFNAELQQLKEKVNDLIYQNQTLIFQRDKLRSKVEMLSREVNGLKRQFEHFSAWMDPSPRNLEALSEIMRKFLQEKNQEAFQKQREEDIKSYSNH